MALECWDAAAFPGRYTRAGGTNQKAENTGREIRGNNKWQGTERNMADGAPQVASLKPLSCRACREKKQYERDWENKLVQILIGVAVVGGSHWKKTTNSYVNHRASNYRPPSLPTTRGQDKYDTWDPNEELISTSMHIDFHFAITHRQVVSHWGKYVQHVQNTNEPLRPIVWTVGFTEHVILILQD